jgi:hypothetical protein
LMTAGLLVCKRGPAPRATCDVDEETSEATAADRDEDEDGGF